METRSELPSTSPDIARRIALSTGLLLLIGLCFLGTSVGRAARKGETAPRAAQSRVIQSLAPCVHVSKDDPSRFEFDSPAAMAKAGISVFSVEERPIVENLEAPGLVTYDQRLMSRLSTRASGTVWSVEKRLGDIVAKGDVLAIVEAVDIGKQKAEFLDRLALYESKAETVKFLEQAAAAIPVSRLRDAQLDLRESRIHLLTSEQTLCNLGIPLRMKEFERLSDAERAAKIQFLGIPDAVVDKLDREVATNNLVPVVAPIDGVVINHEAGEGEWTDPSKPLFEIADLRRMWIRLDVPRDKAPSVRLGQKLSFRGDEMNSTVHCQVSWISTEINRNDRILEVRAEFENPRLDLGTESPAQHRLLRANLTGTGRICVRHNPHAVAVPCECVHHDAEGDVVFVRETETSFVAVRIERGACDGEFVEICGPVVPGAVVLRHGVEMLTVAAQTAGVTLSNASAREESETAHREVPSTEAGDSDVES